MSVQIDLSTADGNQATLTTNFTEQAPTFIAPGANVITDGDTGPNSVDTVTLVLNGAEATESLSLDLIGQTTALLAGINVDYSSSTGTLTLSGGNELNSTWSTILQHVVYNNTSDAPRT